VPTDDGASDDPISRDYAATVRAWLDNVRPAQGDARDAEELEAQIEAQLEELRAAEEELRVQGAELQDTIEHADQQRRRYQDLFDHAPVAYLITDAAGLIQEINAAAVALLRLTPAEAAREPLPLFVRDPADLRRRLGQLARLERVEDWVTEIVPPGGAPIAVQISAKAVGTPDREPEIRWLLRDISHEQAAQRRERALHREQAARAATQRVAERARYLAEVSGDLMGVLDPDDVWRAAAAALRPAGTAALLVELDQEAGVAGEPVMVRAATGSLASGHDLNELENGPLDEETALTMGMSLRNIVEAVHRGEPDVLPGPDAGSSCLVIPLRTRDATHGAIVLWLRPEANVGEELLVNRHLGDRIALALETARLFQEVVRTRRQAEEAGAAEADFLSMVSHELRTPLTAIVSYAELLEARVDDMPEQLRRYARQVSAAAEHQRQLVERILSFKRVQSVGAGGQPEALDFRDIAQFAVGLVRPQVEDKPVELVTELPAGAVRGSCDPGMLRQVLANLLANAVRHTDRGHVRLSLTHSDEWVELTVEDTGSGISPADLPRIYDRFWRGAVTGHERAGSGLGLTIVRELVHHMHGQISVDSEVGVGTRFTVRIPRVAS
jgi:PAS domain S-box-containing protein